jgi:hypothetical protein
MRPRALAVGLLAPCVALLSLWRGVCVVSGPDIDTDAYAHHMIARGILADPGDLAIHWVWLPLFHYLQVPLVALGGTMDDVRWVNVALSAVLPFVLFAYVERTARLRAEGDGRALGAFVALVAALFAASCPIAMQMGTTAQPEPLFALLMLGVAISFQERRYVACSAMLGAATMLRYEAWASFIVIAAVAAVSILSPHVSAWRAGDSPWLASPNSWKDRGDTRVLLALVVPMTLIGAWAVLRRPVDGAWFAFLGQTREFANGATHEKTALDGGLLVLFRDCLYYPVFVPFRVLGPVTLLVPFGVARTIRQQGARFVLVLAACLGFVSFTWIMRSSLGLDRHFVVCVALYATFAAQGAAALADATAEIFARHVGASAGRIAGRVAGAGTAALALAGLLAELSVWMGHWRGSIVRGWPDRAAVGRYLRSIPGDPTIFCDDATVEILSGLDRRRFDRHWIDDDHTWSLIRQAAKRSGVAYVVTWNRKLTDHTAAGTIVFQPAPEDPGSGLAVMRVAGAAEPSTGLRR